MPNTAARGGTTLSHEEGHLGAFSHFVGVRKDSLWTDHDPGPPSESSDKVLQQSGGQCADLTASLYVYRRP